MAAQEVAGNGRAGPLLRTTRPYAFHTALSSLRAALESRGPGISRISILSDPSDPSVSLHMGWQGAASIEPTGVWLSQDVYVYV